MIEIVAWVPLVFGLVLSIRNWDPLPIVMGGSCTIILLIAMRIVAQYEDEEEADL